MKKIIFLLGILISFHSCKKNEEKKGETQKEVKQVSYNMLGQELLNNNKFNSWDTNAKPTNWIINNKIETPENFVVDRDTMDLLLRGHKTKATYIEQPLNLEPNMFYIFEADIETNLKHNPSSGIYIKSKNKILAKRVFRTRARDTYRVIFRTKEKNLDVVCYIGFSKPEEGDIMIKSMSLKKIEVNELIYESEIAQNFFNTLNLNFSDEQSFDNSVIKISKHLSDLLLCRPKKDSVNINRVNKLLPLLTYDDKEEYAFLKRDLSVPVEKITHSFQDKLVFGGMEILREFNIGTKRIDVLKNGGRVHLFYKYYNPFSESWIIIDPFYNLRILKQNNYQNTNGNDLISLDYGGLIISEEKKNDFIRTCLNSEIKEIKNTILSYPF